MAIWLEHAIHASMLRIGAVTGEDSHREAYGYSERAEKNWEQTIIAQTKSVFEKNKCKTSLNQKSKVLLGSD